LPERDSPVLVFWELTKACPLACRHCRAVAQPHRHPQELTTQEGREVIDQVRAMGTPLLILTGGDPMARPDLLELMAYGVERGLRVSLAPSASSRLSRDFLERAKALGAGRLSLSLDGSSPQVHDSFRGVLGSFQQTLKAIERVTEAGLPFQVNTTLSHHNLHDLPELAGFVAASGAVLWDLFFLVPTGRAQKEDAISPQEHEEVYHWLYRLSTEAPFEIKTTAAEAYRRVVLQQGGNNRAWVNDGRGCLFISHIGEVNPSGFLPLPTGNVRQSPLAELYRQSPIFRDLRDPDRLKGKCGVCQYRTDCGGSRARAYALTGDYLEADPSCIYQPEAE
jgi:MoaA/NifB/PqqE/SkfB family radical SAM enzyme